MKRRLGSAKRLLPSLFLLVSCVLVPAACKPKTDDEPEPEKLTACEEWQQSFCGRQRLCAGETYADCIDSVDDVVCYAGAPLRDCTKDLKEVACATDVSGCDPRDIADTPRAYRKCNDYKATYCEWYQGCYPEQIPSPCEADLDAALDCGAVYAVEQPEYDDCIETLQSLACGSLELPEICRGILLMP